MLNCQLISLFKKKRAPQKLLMEPDRCRKPLQSFLYCLCSLSAVEPQVTPTLTHGVMRTGPAHQPAARASQRTSSPVSDERDHGGMPITLPMLCSEKKASRLT